MSNSVTGKILKRYIVLVDSYLEGRKLKLSSLFSILFLVVATIGSGIHYSNAVTKKSESSYEDIVDTIGANTKSQETLKHKFTTPDNNTNQPPVTINRNFMSNDHVANLTAVEPNSTFNSQEKLSRAGPTIFPSLDIYKVTVTFDSITVNDNHEGLFSGNGEYNLAAYVQGKKIDLTDSTEPALCAGWGCPAPPALYDVSSGKTVGFKPGTHVSVYLHGTVPLSIFTVGVEVDGCGLTKLPEGGKLSLEPDFPGLTLADVFKNPQLNWYHAVVTFIRGALLFQHCGRSGIVVVPPDDNDDLGTIVKFYNPLGHSYEPIGWGAGSHTNVVSNIGDYTLRYTITVNQELPGKLIDSSILSNKSQSNNTFTLNKPNP